MKIKSCLVQIASPASLSEITSRLFFLRWIAASLVACVTLIACAMGPMLTDHAFSFDAVRESPEVEILNYRYGNSKQPGAHPPDWSLKEGRVAQGASINGPMLRGDFLYVKWRTKDTGQTYEETVDLAARLPADITDHRIHFVVKDRQLYVYLISPERRPPSMPPNGPRKYDYLKVITVYPDQPRVK